MSGLPSKDESLALVALAKEAQEAKNVAKKQDTARRQRAAAAAKRLAPVSAARVTGPHVTCRDRHVGR